MKEKEFLKQLNSEKNAFGENTEEIVKKLLEEGKAIAVRKKPNFFIRLFSRMQKTKSTSQILEEHFEMVLSNLSVKGQLERVLKMLLENTETIEIIKTHFGAILETATTNEKLSEILKVLLKNPQTLVIIKEHFSDVFKKCNSINQKGICQLGRRTPKEKFLSAIKELPDGDAVLLANVTTVLQEGVTIADIPIFRGLSEEIDAKMQKQLEERKEQIIREMLETGIDYKGEPERRKQCIDDYLMTVTIMLDELLKKENVRMLDIKLIGLGGYSRTYQIGEEVLKIGDLRATHKIPNHRRILQPLIRMNLRDEKNNNKQFACVEVANRVDELTEEEQSKEKLYQIYKELRDNGIIWTDAKFQNVGKLRSKNVATLDGEEITSDPEATGLQGNIDEKVLESGEWVVIDTDYIYDENTRESEIKWIDNSFSKGFENRWLREKQGQVVQKYIDSIERKNTPGSTRTYRNQEER